MGAAVSLAPRVGRPCAFDLDDTSSYPRWRDWKLAQAPTRAEQISVDVADPRALTPAEKSALLECIARANTALYRSPVLEADPDIARRLGAQLGLLRLDANWLAGEDGISSIAVSDTRDERGGFIPYTDRAIRWHTDGYYHPEQRRIHGMILHCVRPAVQGGVNGLLDPEMAYIALREANPAHVHALMQADAMCIPARADEQGVARAAQCGPVFSVDAIDGTLHMRYTARTRSIEWKNDEATRAAVAALEALLASDVPWIIHHRLEAGCGIVGHNVLHERSAFEDQADRPRLLYRARFLDRVSTSASPSWRSG